MLVEILVLSAVVEGTVEGEKGDEEKGAAEGGDKVGAERKVEEAGEKEEEEESQGGGEEPVRDADLLDAGWTSCSGWSPVLLSEASDAMVVVTTPTTVTVTTASDIPATFLALHL